MDEDWKSNSQLEALGGPVVRRMLGLSPDASTNELIGASLGFALNGAKALSDKKDDETAMKACRDGAELGAALGQALNTYLTPPDAS